MTTAAGFSFQEMVDLVSQLHAAGHCKVTPLMVLEAYRPGYKQMVSQYDLDLVYPTVCNMFRKAGADGLLHIAEERDSIWSLTGDPEPGPAPLAGAAWS
jgi:hypothetical protein